MNQELDTKIKEFEEKELKFKKSIKEVWVRHSEFLELFNFRKHPERIENLTSEKVYNPGSKDYFFYWIEYKLKKLGHLSVYNGKRTYTNAVDNIGTLKQLLKIIVNDRLPVSKKIDAHWEDIKGFGGDRHIAKKILFCYYPEEVICAYNTKDLEEISKTLDLEYRKNSYEKYEKSYDTLSVGQKYELFNNLFLNFKNHEPKLKGWDNGFFVGFLYSFPVSRILKKIK